MERGFWAVGGRAIAQFRSESVEFFENGGDFVFEWILFRLLVAEVDALIFVVGAKTGLVADGFGETDAEPHVGGLAIGEFLEAE